MSELEEAKAAVKDAVRKYTEKKIAEAMADWDKKLADVVVGYQTAIAAIPSGKDGVDGKDGESIAAETVVELIVAELTKGGYVGPAGADGKDGINGADGQDGKDAVVDYELLKTLVIEAVDSRLGIAVKAAVDEIPAPKDGLNGLAGKDGQDGQDGQDGKDGRDALDLEIIERLDSAKSYVRGTFAKHRGGLIRAFRNTDPLIDKDIAGAPLEERGWSVVVDGLHEVAVVQGDDLRTFAFGVMTTSGQVLDQKFLLPVILDRDVFKVGSNYEAGDAVSWDGSIWIAQKAIENADRPAPPLWRLSVKRGRDGKDWDAPRAQRSAEPVRLR